MANVLYQWNVWKYSTPPSNHFSLSTNNGSTCVSSMTLQHLACTFPKILRASSPWSGVYRPGWLTQWSLSVCRHKMVIIVGKTNTTFYLLGKLNLNLLLIQDIWSNRPNPAGHKVGFWIPQTKHLKKKHVCKEWVKYWYLWPSLFYQSVTIFMFRTICQHYHHYVSHKSKYSHNTWHKWWLEISTL